ncbi:unnamed protein product [Hymenolepis diminuta]|uniref:Uncharacterized protein n=1 Tax=Hymenolepis diminuta TaxID=6216 RepID=A0A564YHK2_HYMDI|nr:unnamed protein product [Hymenolepis diminuta]
MSKRAHRLPSFYNRLVSPKSTFALMFLSVLTQLTHTKLSVFQSTTRSCQLRTPTRPLHLLSSSAHSPLYLSLICFKLVVASFNTFLV